MGCRYRNKILSSQRRLKEIEEQLENYTASEETPQEQADWNESDTESPSFIKNKPASENAQQSGDTLSFVTTGEKYIWNNKANIWSGTQAEYDLIQTKDPNTIYIITPPGS